MSDIYKRASRKRLRFANLGKGTITAEDLWNISPSKLNAEWKRLNGVVGSLETPSLLTEPTAATTDDRLRMAIIEDVVKTKLADADVAKKRQENIKRKARLVEIKEARAGQKDEQLSDDEIEKELALLSEV